MVCAKAVLAYVLLTHCLLFFSSPYYRWELQRGISAVSGAALGPLLRNSKNSSSSNADGDRQLPRSGVYASTDLLRTIQQHMTPAQGSAAAAAASAATTADQQLYRTAPLMAYTSATDVIHGEGWAARAAVFVAAVAPRALLLARQARLPRQIKMLQLASRDLPAVGPLRPRKVGYTLSCTSPALSMGLGPQPLAKCSVWVPSPHDNSTTERHHQPQQQRHDTGPGQSANDSCPAQLLVATWIILPDSTPEEVAQQLKDIGAQPQPYLAGNRFKSEPGYVAHFIDIWLFLPRAGMLQLVPAMTSAMQQMLYATAVVYLSYLDMLQLARTMRKLQRRAMEDGRFLGTGPWDNFMVAVSMLLQLLLMTCVRAGVSGLGALTAGGGVMYVLEHGISTTPILQELLRPLDWVSNPSGTAKAAAASVLTFFAVLQLQDVAFMLLWGLLCVLLVGLLFSSLVDAWGWEEEAAARVSIGIVGTLLITGMVFWFDSGDPSMALPKSAATSTSWLVRLAARATAAAAASATPGNSTAAAAAASGASRASRLAALWKLAAKPLALLPRLPRWQRLQRFSVACSSLFKDVVVLSVAVAACEELQPLGDAVWKGLVQMAAEAGVLFECAGSALALLMAGGSWRAAWNRFCVLFEQRFQQLHGPGAQGFQAQLVIHAQNAALADVGHTADALRALADEIENLDGPGGALQQQQLFPNGRLVLPRQQRAPKLGTHWPAPLQIDFDVEDLRGELGIDVPRGFVCPLTLDIMKQPALLISSNIAVPSSYEKEAISTWLQESRRDPKTRRVLASDAQLVPNFDLYRAIEDWVAHAHTLRAQHMQQQAQAQTDAAAAAAGGDAAAGPGLRRAASAPVAAAAGPRPASSTGTISSLLAAARGAMVRGTAAAAVAAGQRRRRSTRAAAAAAAGVGRRLAQDPHLFPVPEAEGLGPAAAAAGGASGGARGAYGRHLFGLPGGSAAAEEHEWGYYTEEEDGDYSPGDGEEEEEDGEFGDMLEDEDTDDAAEDLDAVDSFRPQRQDRTAGPSTAGGWQGAAGVAAGVAAAAAAAAQQPGSPTERYNLRRRSSASQQ